MRVRRTAWSLVGRAGRRGPARAALRAHYHAVVSSLVRATMGARGVRAVYAYGSYADGRFRPGSSDVDLAAVIDDLPPEREAALLAALRRRYAAHGAVLPIDFTVLPVGEFERSAAWHAFRRLRIGEDRPTVPVRKWKLLAGAEVRSGDGWEPDPRLSYLTDTQVLDALDAWARAVRHPERAVAARLWELDYHARGEELEWDAALELASACDRLLEGGGARDAVAAIAAALGVIDEHRRRHPVPIERRPLDTDGWRVEPATPEAVAAARRVLAGVTVRSATVHRPPFQHREILLLECGDLSSAREAIRWAVETGAAEAARAGLRVQVLTSRLAEDTWRSNGLRWVSLANASEHLAGEPLAPRIGLPGEGPRLQLSRYHGVFATAAARGWMVVRRKTDRSLVVPMLSAHREIAAGRPPVTDPRELMRRVPELAALGSSNPRVVDALAPGEWATLALELWHGWPAEETGA